MWSPPLPSPPLPPGKDLPCDGVQPAGGVQPPSRALPRETAALSGPLGGEREGVAGRVPDPVHQGGWWAPQERGTAGRTQERTGVG